MTRKTRNMEWGYGRWLGNEWVEAIANGETASREAARELADEVMQYRKLRRLLVEESRTYGDLLEERFGRLAKSLLLGVVSRLCSANDLYSDAPVRRTATADAVASLLDVAAAHPDAAEAIRAALVLLAPTELNPCLPTDTTTGEVERGLDARNLRR